MTKLTCYDLKITIPALSFKELLYTAWGTLIRAPFIIHLKTAEVIIHDHQPDSRGEQSD